jgi:hypothetical protein
VNRLAINQSTGHVYALDMGRGVVDQFDAAGTPTNFTALGKSSLSPTAACGSGFSFGGEPDISVDNSGGANQGDIYVNGQESGICAYDSAGNFLWKLPPPGNNCGSAVDSLGNIWIGDYNNSLIHKYANNGSAGNPPAETGSIADTTGNPCHLAFDSSGAPEVAFINKYYGQVDKFVSGTYNATYDSGSNLSVAVDPGTHHLYTVTSASFSEYDISGPPAPAISQSGPPVLQSGVGIAVNGTGEPDRSVRASRHLSGSHGQRGHERRTGVRCPSRSRESCRRWKRHLLPLRVCDQRGLRTDRIFKSLLRGECRVCSTGAVVE